MHYFSLHNHYSKRILNLILNRKKFFWQENGALDKQKTAANTAVLEGLGVRGQESGTEDRGAAYRFRVFRVFRGSNLCVLCVLCGYHLHSYPALSPLSVYSVYFVVHLLTYLKTNHGIHGTHGKALTQGY